VNWRKLLAAIDDACGRVVTFSKCQRDDHPRNKSDQDCKNCGSIIPGVSHEVANLCSFAWQ
jgi:hypothetical protein